MKTLSVSTIFILAPLAKSEDLEDNEKQNGEVQKQVVIGNEIVQAAEDSKEMTVSRMIIRRRYVIKIQQNRDYKLVHHISYYNENKNKNDN